jgi:hypothetical protein
MRVLYVISRRECFVVSSFTLSESAPLVLTAIPLPRHWRRGLELVSCILAMHFIEASFDCELIHMAGVVACKDDRWDFLGSFVPFPSILFGFLGLSESERVRADNVVKFEGQRFLGE